MANPKRSYPDNLAGEFFVDDTCIDCDLCRQIAPPVFTESGDHSIVHHQPDTELETLRPGMALVACPTGSIGTRSKINLTPVLSAFPEPIADNVYFCGYASPDSYGAASYLVCDANTGNTLVDSPRFASQLVRRFEEMGGLERLLLTHRDDVADHQKFHDRFGCRRVIHQDDAQGIRADETLDGREPMVLDEDWTAIPVPGHTRGSMVFLYRNRFLFTGDHLAWSVARNGLIAFRSVTWYSWREQTQSMKRLLDFQFEWVLPGHGHRTYQPAKLMRQKLEDCIDWMEKTL